MGKGPLSSRALWQGLTKDPGGSQGLSQARPLTPRSASPLMCPEAHTIPHPTPPGPQQWTLVSRGPPFFTSNGRSLKELGLDGNSDM